MQKVFESCNELDKRCYEQYGLNEDILMEHAAAGMESFIRAKFAKNCSVLIVAGAGNNGADGIALARLLYGDYEVKLYLHDEPKSDMAKRQLKRALSLGVKLTTQLQDATIIVDAMFGSGLTRELDNRLTSIIDTINGMSGYKIACDMPTGIDTHGNIKNVAFVADVTLCMGALKRSYYLDEVKDFVGEIQVVNLGVTRELYEIPSDTHLLENSDFMAPSRKTKNAHKGSFGHAVIFCGEKEGAGIMSGEAACRFGAGLTTLVMREKHELPAYLMHSYSLPLNATAIGIGMGLGNHFEESFLDRYIASNELPLVIDADALYNPTLLKLFLKTKRMVIMTPHPKEFVYLWKALGGEDIELEHLQANRFEYAKRFTAKFPDIVLLLKGANMLIAKSGQIYINTLGSSKLSKGGSGDVLSGLIVSLLAQGYGDIDAAISGSLALCLASQKFDGASYAMLPTDLISNLTMIGK